MSIPTIATAEQLQTLISTAKLNQSIQEQRSIERHKFRQSTIVAHNGGMFTITPELLLHLRFIVADLSPDDAASTIIIDDNSIPIRIDDCNQVLTEWTGIWRKATNQYATEYAKLKAIRTISSITK